MKEHESKPLLEELSNSGMFNYFETGQKSWQKDGYDFRLTCFACPEQYDVYFNDKQVAYIRLRHGHLRVDVPDVGGKTIYEHGTIGDGTFYDTHERELYFNIILKLLKENNKV